MSGNLQTTEAITREVRACFNRLKAAGDALHRDLGVTSAMRAVLEALHEGGSRTVPSIAREKRVTRQHIQVIVNDLLAAGWAATSPNPADKRSPLVGLTAKGRATFQRMRKAELKALEDLAKGLQGNDLRATLSTLEALRERLEALLAQLDPDAR